MRPNRLRQLLRAGQPSLGTRLHSPWPTMIELVGHTGLFDYVEFMAEFAPFDLFSLENQGRAIEPFDYMTGMIKIGHANWAALAGHALNYGFQNILFADIRTAEDAALCVAAVRADAPEAGGTRGVGMGRDVRIVLDGGSPTYVQATRDSVVALMIEKREAIENLEAILAVRGVDMVQFGPADYAMSLGLAGEKQHPAVREAETYMIQMALKRGVAARAELRTSADVERYLELGVRHFSVGMDVRILFSWYQEHGERMRARLAVL